MMSLSILSTTLWIIAFIGLTVLLLIVLFILFFKQKMKETKKEARYLYSEIELEPGIWAHNDGIAAILIREESSEEEKDCPNKDEAWVVENIEDEMTPGAVEPGIKRTLMTGNGRKWIFEMNNPNWWNWLIKLPLIRFLNDPEYRERIEGMQYNEGCDSDIELLIACCLLHAPEYHSTFQEPGKTQEQIDVEQAERILLSSSKKGNTNAMFELICLYHSRGEYEKAIELNIIIKSKTGRGIWLVDRFEKTLYKKKETPLEQPGSDFGC